MNIKTITPLICLILLLAACKDKTPKPTEKQYSTWIVNGTDTFITNNVDTQIACNPDKSFCIADLRSNDQNNRFDLAFYLDYYPESGNWPLTRLTTQDQSYARIGIYYQTRFYIPSTIAGDTLLANTFNGKGSYTLSPVWFIRSDSATNDSILIQGTFNIP